MPPSAFGPRLANGKVEGFSPADAVAFGPATTLGGLLERAADAILEDRPLALPARLATLADARLPVNLLCSAPTSFRDAGAPLLDARGRLVALAFDRPKHALAADFGASLEARTAAVDVRYLLWLVGAYGGNTALAEEILRDS